MKKILLAALLPGVMLGSTLSATVSCGGDFINGVPSGSDLLLAQCTGFGGSAMATVTATSVSAQSSAIPGSPGSFANASITGEYQFTIFGSTGPAFIVACVTAEAGQDRAAGTAQASVSFAGGKFAAAASSSFGGPPVSNCDNGGFLEPGSDLPFTFGQPFLIDGTMSAESNSGFFLPGGSIGDARFSGIVALDSNCVPSCTNSDIISGTSFTLALVPEPATGLLILGPLGLIARSLRKHRAGR